MSVLAMDLHTPLRKYFGYTHFRGQQEEIIRSVLAGENVLVIMPTGAGKSLCYQLPALLMEGTALVVSPLIALMKNQVDQMQAYDIQAAYLNSSLSRSEYENVKKRVLQGKVKLLYVAPETLVRDEFSELLTHIHVSFLAVDEAHCISEWGHDFRPEYRRIRMAISHLPPMPLIALTATATPKVQLDILQNLEIEDAKVFRSSFNRPNLFYEIRPKTPQTQVEIVRYIRSKAGRSGIVYCHSRRRVEEIAQMLRDNGIKALPYHAGMDSETRARNQDAFLNEEVQVIVATIAFGMGIDKPDVRFIIHYDVPKSIENYYQETGRAGRDGEISECILYYDYQDILKLDRFLKDKPVTEREAIVYLLQEMMLFCESGLCRRQVIMHYFGEPYEPHMCAQMCDNCRSPRPKFKAKREVQAILQTIFLTGEKFPMMHVAEILLGKPTEPVRYHGHDKLPTWGALKNLSDKSLQSIFAQLIAQDFIHRDVVEFGVLGLGPQGKSFLQNPYDIELFVPYNEIVSQPLDSIEEETFHDEILLRKLKELRKKIAKERKVPPYVIFQEPTLIEMATRYPITLRELELIRGVGPQKARKFGPPFIQLIQDYVQENQIERPQEFIIQTAPPKTTRWRSLIEYIDRRMPLEEIMDRLGLSEDEVLSLIEKIVESGTKLQLKYLLRTCDPDVVEDIEAYFANCEDNDLEKAIRALGQYSIRDIRLVRVAYYAQEAF